MPLLRADAADHQRAEAEHDAGDDIAGEHNKYRAHQPGHGPDKVIEIEFGDVAQHQEPHIHQGWRGGIGGHQIGERREEQHQQEQAADHGRGQAGFAPRRRARGRFDIDGSRGRPHQTGEDAADRVGTERLAAVDDVTILIEQVGLPRHGADGAGGIEYRRHHQRQHAGQHQRREGPHDIQTEDEGLALIVREARQGEQSLILHRRIENQAEDGDGDDHQQDPPRYSQLLQPEDHRKADQGHDDRHGGKSPQRHRQPLQRVLDHQPHPVGGNKQQEETDTDAGTVGNPHGQVVEDPATHPGHRDGGKQHPHQEYGPQRHRNGDLLPQHQTEGGKRREGNSAADGHRQLGPEPHQERTEPRHQTGGDKHGAGRKARLAEHARHHDHRVDHGKEGGEARQHLLSDVAAPLADHKVAIKSRERLLLCCARAGVIIGQLFHAVCPAVCLGHTQLLHTRLNVP